MQSVKLAVRNVGNPHGALGVVTAQQLEQDIEYNFTSKGYELKESHYLGAVPNPEGNGIQGYKFAFVFVKDDPAQAHSVGVGEVPLTSFEVDGTSEAKRKPGRPTKA